MLDQLRPAVRGVVIDMDGVLWKDSTPIGDLSAVFDGIKARGLKVIVATNNATLTVEDNLGKLRGFGVRLEGQEVVTSAEATAHTLTNELPGGEVLSSWWGKRVSSRPCESRVSR